MSRLVAISNRVSVPRRGAVPGGLAVGLLSAMQSNGGLWFGWNGQTSESPARDVEVIDKDGISYATFELSRKEYESFYIGFSNGVLWPLFHYFLDAFHYVDEDFDCYVRVNKRFAETLSPLLKSDDLIWVHDYHLIPLAQKLREAGSQHAIGFFLHIPFPTFEVLRVLPVYGELLHAMLHYDVVGFQTEQDLAAFRSAIVELWGKRALSDDGTVLVGDRRVQIGVFPIGVDVEAIQDAAARAQATDACRRMVAGMLGRKLMIGVDRLDYSKGLVERFRAYERFLETYPENENQVTFLQIAPLSRSDVRAYSEIRRKLEQATGRTNGRFADTDWTPIRYLNRNFPHDNLMGFFRAAGVGIVTPVRDGMNLVAKEFVAAQDPENPGVLILSTFAGAARELTSAVQVNPYDMRGIAQAIQRALTMTLPERKERHRAMLEVLRRNDIHAWHTNFIQRLNERNWTRATSKSNAQGLPLDVSH